MIEYQMLLDRIRALCEEKNMSYYSLACKSNVPITTIMNIMHGITRNPGIFTIIKICDGLGITILEFFEQMEIIDADKKTQKK